MIDKSKELLETDPQLLNPRHSDLAWGSLLDFFLTIFYVPELALEKPFVALF